MPPKFHTAHTNVAFDRIIRLVETSLERSPQTIAGYSPRDFSARLTQRIVELTLYPFVEQCIHRLEAGAEPVVTGPVIVNLGGMLVNLATGTARPSRHLFLRSFAAFFLHWLHVFVNLLSGLWQPGSPDLRPATLLFGVGRESLFVDGSDARFVRFCSHGRIAPLAAAQRLIIQASSTCRSSLPEQLHYCRFPLFLLAGTTSMSLATRMKGMLDHILIVGTFLEAVWRWPVTVILARDFAYLPLVAQLDRLSAIEAIVITNSAYSSQPLWMRALPSRRFSVHMVWYSQNTIPLVYAQDRIKSDVPNNRHIFADVSWVWTAGYADYLKRLGIPGEMRAIGPILWHLPEAPRLALAETEIRIAVFDVTPVRDEFARKIGLNYNYYRTENMIKFINDILSIRNAIRDHTGKPVRIFLKQKRAYNPSHDLRYTELIEKLTQSGDIELTPFHVNLYSILSDNHFSVVIPYSSPAYVARHVGKTAIYYDPSCELLPTHEAAPRISFASGRTELLQTALRLLEDPMSQAAARGI